MEMSLSQAMRLGAMNKPQGFGDLSSSRLVRGWRGWLLRQREDITCALGAAHEANNTHVISRIASIHDLVGVSYRGAEVSWTAGATVLAYETPAAWPMHVATRCPACETNARVLRIIPHLNDHHRWTREQIADWVETIEHAQDAARVPEHLEVAD